MEVTGHLENWWKDPFFKIVWGQIYDDIKGRFPDGTLIHTSDIVSWEDEYFINTLNSRYSLGNKKVWN